MSLWPERNNQWSIYKTRCRRTDMKNYWQHNKRNKTGTKKKTKQKEDNKQ